MTATGLMEYMVQRYSDMYLRYYGFMLLSCAGMFITGAVLYLLGCKEKNEEAYIPEAEDELPAVIPSDDDMVIRDIDELLPPAEEISRDTELQYIPPVRENKKDDRPAILAFICAVLAAVGLSALFVSRMNKED